MNIITPVSSYTGYGITGYNILNSLSLTNSSIKLFPIGNISLESHWNKKMVSQCINNKINFDPLEPCVKIWHDNDLITRTCGKSRYGVLSFFELDTISTLSRLNYNLADIVFAPSQWAKDILIENNINSKIIVCPQGVDRSIFKDEVWPNDKDIEKYIFINIGKWEIRKGHDILVDIFNQAFTSDDNVELWMINHNSFLNTEQTSEWIKLYKNSKLSAKIKIFDRLPSQLHLAKIISYADCGIFPSRAEGWNNEAIEVMSMNKPVIITNYSAHTEYCNDTNSYLINIENKIPAIDNIWFNGEGSWADIDDSCIDQAINYMQYVYKNDIRTNIHGISTAQKYTWANTAKIITEYMS